MWNTGVTLSDCRAEAARIFEQQVVPAVSATPECAVRFGREATYGSDAAHLSKKANGKKANILYLRSWIPFLPGLPTQGAVSL